MKKHVTSSVSPNVGDLRHDFGIWFVYTGLSWVPDRILKNVITTKNAGAGRLYGAHPVKK